jgi:hypothetical protein
MLEHERIEPAGAAAGSAIPGGRVEVGAAADLEALATAIAAHVRDQLVGGPA